MADKLALGLNGLPLPNLGDPSYVGNRLFYVTLHNWDDNDSFYNDMESASNILHIPNRVVECTDRLPGERSTGYIMSYDEAVELTKDPRVAAVELNPDDRGSVITRQDWVSTGTFTKAIALSGSDTSWGIFRTRAKVNPTGWGNGGTDTLTSRTVLSDVSGKNVDVVVIDGGLPFPSTLEYQQNPDGTGYPRMVTYNWFQHNLAVTGAAASQYAYTSNYVNGHQAHTSGTAAGNTHGFARDANIHNLTYNDPTTGIGYVKEFHRNKKINPLTGVKNPTVTNNSWGYGGSISSYTTMKLNLSRVHYRGVDYFPTSGTAGSYVWSDATLASCGIPSQWGNGWPDRNAVTDAAFIDAAKAGVINVVSAGNSFFYVAKPSSDPAADYNNYLVYSSSVYYYHRGSSPGAADEVVSSNYNLDYAPILVGAMGAVVTGTMSASTISWLYGSGHTDLLQQDYKSEFSNYGPRVDVYAPGETVLSVINSTSYSSGVTTDPRVAALGSSDSTNNKFARDAGTSMSGPHVCGVLACVLEKYPRMTHPQARDWISATSLVSLVTTTGGAQDATDAGSWEPTSNKKILYLPGTRVREAEVGGFYPAPYPTVNASYRSTGAVWPRTNKLVARTNNATFNLVASASTVSNGGTVNLTLTTTNIPNGTQVPYIISAHQGAVSSSYVDNGVTGVYTSSTALTGTITGFNSRPTTGHRMTTGLVSGTWTSITSSLLGAASLTSSTLPTGSNDDGYWTLTLPFNITFEGVSYSTIYVGTNFYITFGAGRGDYAGLGATSPPVPKIMISAADNSAQRIYYGTEGSAPNRTYRVRLEGNNAISGTLGAPTIVYEAVFYENNPTQFDIQVGANSRNTISAVWHDFDYSRINSAPLTGNFTVTNNTAVLPITISSTNAYNMNVRLNMFPAPNVWVAVN